MRCQKSKYPPLKTFGRKGENAETIPLPTSKTRSIYIYKCVSND